MDQHMLPVRISYFILNRLARARQTTPEGIHYFPWYMDISVPSGDILIETFGLSLVDLRVHIQTPSVVSPEGWLKSLLRRLV